MVTRKSKFSVRILIIQFHSTYVGQLIVRIGRNLPFSFWSRTKQLRVKLLSDSNISSASTKAFPLLTNKPSDDSQKIQEALGLEPRKPIKIKSHRKIVRIMSPDFSQGHHDIGNLARYYSEYLGNKFSTIIFSNVEKGLRPFSPNVLQLTGEKVDKFAKVSLSSIYHLGNSPRSADHLKDFFLNDGHKIVVLHDIWMFDLFGHFGLLVDRPSLGYEMVQNQLGIFGTRGIHNFHTGKSFDRSVYLAIGKLFLEPVIRESAKVVIHNKRNELAKWILDNYPSKVLYSNLPFGYFDCELPIDNESLMIDSVLISINGFNPNDSEFIQELVSGILNQGSVTKVICFGESIEFLQNQAFWRSIKQRGIPKNSLRLIRNFTDREWASMLNSNLLGIRLGVGKYGESSGLVRDFLLAGMTVITNEHIEFMKGNPRYFRVEDNIDVKGILMTIEHLVKQNCDALGIDHYLSAKNESLKNYNGLLNALENEIHAIS
jgi:hypothetical protein